MSDNAENKNQPSADQQPPKPVDNLPPQPPTPDAQTLKDATGGKKTRG